MKTKTAKIMITAALAILIAAANAHAGTTVEVKIAFEIPNYVRVHDRDKDNNKKREHKRNHKSRDSKAESKVYAAEIAGAEEAGFDVTANCDWKVKVGLEDPAGTETKVTDTIEFKGGEAKFDYAEALRARLVSESAANGAAPAGKTELKTIVYKIMTD